MKLTPTEFFATLLFHRPGLTARQMSDAYLRYLGKDPLERKTTKKFFWSTDSYRDVTLRRWSGLYSSYFYTEHRDAWNGRYGSLGANGRQLGRLWKSTMRNGVQHFFLLPKGYRKIAVTSDGRPIDLALYLSKQLSFSFEPRKCA